jgi:hypothetical protein
MPPTTSAVKRTSSPVPTERPTESSEPDVEASREVGSPDGMAAVTPSIQRRVPDGGSKAACVESAGGCLWDSGWRPTAENTFFTPLAADDGEGTGCYADDAANESVYTSPTPHFRAGSRATIRIDGRAAIFTHYGDPEAFTFRGPQGELTVRVGEQTGAYEEGEVHRATLIFQTWDGQIARASVMLSCGA